MAKNWNSRMIEEIFYKTDKFDIAVCGLIMSWFRNLAQAIIEKKKVFVNKLRNRHFRLPVKINSSTLYQIHLAIEIRSEILSHFLSIRSSAPENSKHLNK